MRVVLTGPLIRRRLALLLAIFFVLFQYNAWNLTLPATAFFLNFNSEISIHHCFVVFYIEHYIFTFLS